MSEQDRTSDSISAKISGDVSGQVAVGKDIVQTQAIGQPPPAVTEEELAALNAAFADLRSQVEAQAPPGKKEPALERVDELQQAVVAEEPDLSTMEYVKQWFCKNLPAVAGTVTSVVVNPIVGKLVEAAGDTLANEFRRRFGEGR